MDDKNINELKEKSPLCIYEWVQFLKDERNSLEAEKRYLSTKFIAIIYTIFILIFVFVRLLDNQISLDMDINIKLISASWILIASLQFYKLSAFSYEILFHERILRIINVGGFIGINKASLVISNIISFIIIFIYSPWGYSNPLIPLDILESKYYLLLLLLFGLDSANGILIFFKIIKFPDRELPPEELRIIFPFVLIYLLLIFSLIVWVLLGLESPYELLKIQIESGLIIVLVLFITVNWARPFYSKLNEIAERISRLNILIDDVLLGKIRMPEEIRDNYFKK